MLQASQRSITSRQTFGSKLVTGDKTARESAHGTRNMMLICFKRNVLFPELTKGKHITLHRFCPQRESTV
jgi:hypothetical protein